MTVWDIKSLPLFEGLNPAQIHTLLRHSQKVQYQKGDCICKCGEKNENIFVVAQGRVAVLSNAGVMLEVLNEKKIFGEIGFLFGTPWTASIVAKEDSNIVSFDKKLIENFSKTDPSAMNILYKNILLSLKNRLAEATCLIERLSVEVERLQALHQRPAQVYDNGSRRKYGTFKAGNSVPLKVI